MAFGNFVESSCSGRRCGHGKGGTFRSLGNPGSLFEPHGVTCCPLDSRCGRRGVLEATLEAIGLFDADDSSMNRGHRHDPVLRLCCLRARSLHFGQQRGRPEQRSRRYGRRRHFMDPVAQVLGKEVAAGLLGDAFWAKSKKAKRVAGA